MPNNDVTDSPQMAGEAFVAAEKQQREAHTTSASHLSPPQGYPGAPSPGPSSSSSPANASQRGRDRARSFLGLGLGSMSPTASDSEASGPGTKRKISFGPLGPAASSGVGGGHSGELARGVSPGPAATLGPSRKTTSGAKAFLRRAKSFGTSPVLGSSSDGGFASNNPSTTSLTSPQSTSPGPSSPRPQCSQSSLLLEPADERLQDPTDLPELLAPNSPYAMANPYASTSSMVLSESIPEQPHWLSAPAPTRGSSDARSRDRSERSSSERSRTRRSDDASRRPSAEDAGAAAAGPARADTIKGKGKTEERASTTPKRKTRRGTLGNLFGRKESKNDIEARATADMPRNETQVLAPSEQQPLQDSPREASAATFARPDPGGESPTLPSLPSLQFGRNPYRMSWAYAQGSPNSSPEKPRPPRPRVSVSTDLANSHSGPSSPVVALTPAEVHGEAEPTVIVLHGQNDPPALRPPPPPRLQHAHSTDSAATLQIQVPKGASPLDTLESAREDLKASSPPILRRRSNSYGFPSPSPTSPRPGPFATTSSSPQTLSPLASPAATDSPSQSAASSPKAVTPTAAAATNSFSGSSFGKGFIKTRGSRSQSDASDRRLPQSPASDFAPAAGRSSFAGSLGGGSAPQPIPRASLSRPATGDAATTSTRSSVFGSIGSFFSGSNGGGSASMSRSASATNSAGTVTTPSASPTLAESAREVNEFGALFDGGGKRSSSQARTATNRKRGMSVGAGNHFSLFGTGGSSASLAVPPAPSSNGTASTPGRGRSGSASSANTSVSGSGSGPLTDLTAGLPGGVSGSSSSAIFGGRMRALTDPNRRFSFALQGGSGSESPSLSPSRDIYRPRGSSLGAFTPASFMPPPPKKARKAPPPLEDETPIDYVRRLIEGSEDFWRRASVESLGAAPSSGPAEDDVEPIPRGELTKVLSASPEPFFCQALHAFLRLFPFQDLALDVALRVFLCSAALPTETQHIDRVMEAFARRYCECNPGIFGGAASKREVGEEGLSAEGTEEGRAAASAKNREGKEESDVPYVLAFSMVMLNTDHFNPNAKTKMTKADYVKNTRMDGVAPELLEYLFDQITLAPFVYVEDNTHLTSSALPTPSSMTSLGASIGPSTSSSSFISAAGSSGNQGFFGPGAPSKSKIDPYQLIASGSTKRYRVDVVSLVPPKSPFSFSGTTAFFDMTSLHSLFAHAPVLQISNRSGSMSKGQIGSDGRQPPSSSMDPATIESPNPLLYGSPLVPTSSNGTFVEVPKKKDRPAISSLKITKVGLLSRKEDLIEGGRKSASRKWRGWSVVLTGSQLLFFKDPYFAGSLQAALDRAAASAAPRPEGHVLAFSYPGSFRPDAVLSLAHSVAIYDSSYAKYRNVFRLVAPAGRQYLFQAHDPDELNGWIHAINFAAAFKSANIKVRPLSPHLPHPNPRATPPPSGRPSTSEARPTEPARLFRSQGQDSPSNGSSASLGGITGPRGPGTTSSAQSSQKSTPSPSPPIGEGDRPDKEMTLSQVLAPPAPEPGSPASLTARAEALRTKVAELDALIRATKQSLQADLRFAKHLALLTPFKTSTRERLLACLPPVERRVRHLRMQLAKHTGYREVLMRDLLVEDRQSERLMRKQSLHRTHSRRTSSINRRSSRGGHSRDSSLRLSSGPPHLGRSSSSRLRPSDLAASEPDASPRHSFEGDLSAFEDAHEGPQHSLTDDELDRLQAKAPPPMQRSKTETDWAPSIMTRGHLLRPPLSHAVEGDPDAEHTGSSVGEDELEERAGGIDAAPRRSSESRRRSDGMKSLTPPLSLSEGDAGSSRPSSTLPPSVPPAGP